MNLDKMEMILSTIDKLGAVSVKQLHEILKLGSYRHTCRIITQLEEYFHVIRSNQKIIYLNKEGRQLIGSLKEIKKSHLINHTLLANDAFIYYDCPLDWKREYSIELKQEPIYDFGIKIKGLSVVSKKIIIPDAVFTRNGYVYLVEIDNTRTMNDNKKKIETYKENWNEINKHFGLKVILCVFTKSQKRSIQFKELCRKIPNDIQTFKEVGV